MNYLKTGMVILIAIGVTGCAASSARKKTAPAAPAPVPENPADWDKDGVPDQADKCPDAAETPNGYRDDDGCPDADPSRAVLTGAVVFELNSVSLKAASDGIIGQAADLLVKNPAWKVRIEGHTDTYGAPAYNLDLSRRRAESVKSRLVKKFGAAPERVTTAGYGGTRPIASLETREGRLANRRIEFVFGED